MDKRKKIAIIAVVLLVIGIILKFTIFKGNFLYAGTIEATKVDLSSRLASVIATQEVSEGQEVQSGQVLLQFACEDIKKAESELANKNFERGERLFTSGSMAKEAMDQIKYKKQMADIRMDWCTVKSPLHGTLLNKYRETGELVNPGAKLFTLANLDEVWAYIYVPQTLLAKLSTQMKIKGLIPELSMKEIEGQVTKINEEAEFTPKNVQTRDERTRLVYGIKITFKNTERILKPGMTIEVKLED